MADDDHRGAVGRAPPPHRHSKHQYRDKRAQCSQPNGRQKWSTLQQYMIPCHGNMIPMNAPALPTLRVLILAAGLSRRLGQPKALARVHGVSLIRRLLLLLAPLAAAR